MTGAAAALFFLVVAGFIAHELDAVHRHEWRLLFVLRGMPDEAARRAFVLLHVPLFAVLLWLIAHPDAAVRFGTMLGVVSGGDPAACSMRESRRGRSGTPAFRMRRARAVLARREAVAPTQRTDPPGRA